MELSFDTTRRGFLGLGLGAVACGMASPAWAKFAAPAPRGTRALAFHNLHTGERLSIAYWKDGAYDRAAWGQINHILRDHYSGEASVMNLGLMDLLHDLQGKLGTDRPVEIISGYRSPTTNKHLAAASSGVAKGSYHMRGMAIDVRMDGIPLSTLRNAALGMGRGGVGYYPSSQFVHLDVGPVRRWG